jgi:hypothetical protein
VEPNRERIEDLMRRYGYEEAEAAYHIGQAWSRFTEMYQAEAQAEAESGTFPRLRTQIFLQSHVDPHFAALISLLARGVLGRTHPEGWGSRPAPEQEGVSEAPDPADPTERERPGESPEDPALD